MALFILIGVAIVWFCLMRMAARKILARSENWRRVKIAALTAFLTLVPFAHEIYVYYGFQVYCRVYGGIVKLEPVETDSLSFDNFPTSEYRLLMHPAITHVQYVGKLRDWSSPPLSLSRNPAECVSEIHKKRINSKNSLNKKFAELIVSQGFCYSNNETFDEPRYSLTSAPTGTSQYHLSQSLFYPRDVRVNADYVLIDTFDGSVKSRFSQLDTRPGLLANILIPEMRSYRCPDTENFSRSATFPFDSVIYKFLEKAIVKDGSNA